MIIGVPKEIKISENRVGMTEAGAKQLTKEGHKVIVEKDAGVGSGITNEQYEKAGAKIIDSKKEVYAKADMIMKVKEPLPDEPANSLDLTLFHNNVGARVGACLFKARCSYGKGVSPAAKMGCRFTPRLASPPRRTPFDWNPRPDNMV